VLLYSLVGAGFAMAMADRLPRPRLALTFLSFLLPLAAWALVSYVPWIWHPLIHITDPGSVDYYSTDADVPRADFQEQVAKARAANVPPPQGYRVNPVYLPAPHAVARAFYTAFKTPPRLQDEPWLHQSLGRSIRTIFLGFLFSSLIGVPLGILSGTYRFFAKLQEPFIEFFRYLPAPAFGALCVAVLGNAAVPAQAAAGPRKVTLWLDWYPNTDHVGIYVGKGFFVHASVTNGVHIDSVTNPYYYQRLVSVRKYRGF